VLQVWCVVPISWEGIMEFLSGLSIGCILGFILAGLCGAASKHRKKLPIPSEEDAEGIKTIA
jgi:hypothetical protein